MENDQDKTYLLKFAVALVEAREGKGKNRSQFATDIGASSNGVKRWETAEVFPDPKWWRAIKDVAGIDPADYRPPIAPPGHSITQHTPTRSPAINAQHVGSIQISADDHGPDHGHYELLSDLEHEVLTLFRKYGNPTLLERCLRQLREAQAIFG
jgi:hypothetical protein